MNVATVVPVSRSHTFSVLSQGADTAGGPSLSGVSHRYSRLCVVTALQIKDLHWLDRNTIRQPHRELIVADQTWRKTRVQHRRIAGQ
jgi:hypothetical protein